MTALAASRAARTLPPVVVTSACAPHADDAAAARACMALRPVRVGEAAGAWSRW
ncbi:MAG: hypothetical protein R3A10_15680 [Caldilineaceae bacterium]